MNLKTWLYWLYDRAKNYNLFMLDVDDYQDDEDEEREDPAILLKHQKYTTRLYIVFLMSKSYRDINTAILALIKVFCGYSLY